MLAPQKMFFRTDDPAPYAHKLFTKQVQINEVYGGRYRVRKKLGWGHFSTVWMVDDLTKIGADGVTEELASDGSGRPKLLALKVQKSAEHYTEAALDEVRV
jgi:serine/threonine-protein kinase SRPK3